MPRKKTEPTDEPKAAVRRRAASKRGEPAENAESAAEIKGSAAEAPEETPVRKKRTYVRKKDEENTVTEAAEVQEEQPVAEEKKSRRGRKRTVAEATGTLFPEEEKEAAEQEDKKTVKRTRRSPKKEPEAPVNETAEAAEPPQAEAPSDETAEPAGADDDITPDAAQLAQATESESCADEAPEEKNEDIEIEKEIEAASETEDGAEACDEGTVENRNLPVVDSQKNDRGQIRHQHPKLGFNQLAGQTLAELRKIAKEIGVTSITTRRKDDLINDILKTQAEALGYRFNGGTLECMSEGYGFLRPSGLLPSSNDIYVSASQIRRFGLRNGDVVWGIIRPPKDQEHYEALLRVENVNFTDPVAARRRPHFEALTPIFPTEKLELETDRKQIATRIVDIFAPIGKGQRALIVSPPKAGKTTLLKNLAHSITTNHPEVILMVLLIDERPEEVTDMARSVDGEIIASTFDRPAEEHLRVAGLALEKAKRLVEVSKDVVLLLDSITRLARASNLIVPPSGRTLSGGMDPAALYFPKKFFGAARNIENGGSLTIIGTSLVETGSRMDDVIYEEFKGTGNMEVHLSRKISEQRIFPALDITRSGTRKEELMVPEGDLQRIWGLRRKIANMDEAEVLNLILDKLRNTPTNRDFLATIKAG